MGYVLPSFGLSSAQIASLLSRYARITPSFTYNLTSKIVSKSDKANKYNPPLENMPPR